MQLPAMTRASRILPYWKIAIVTVALTLSALGGANASLRWFAVLVIGLVLAILIRRFILCLPLLICVALIGQTQINTGTEVSLNPAAVLVPLIIVLWLVDGLRHRNLRLPVSTTTRPLALFLFAGFISLLAGNVLWDPAVPRSDYFILVQLAQWAIFAFSAGAFWLTANLVRHARQLQRLTSFFLFTAGGLALLFVLVNGSGLIASIVTITFVRAPFWVLLTSLAGSQLLFNSQLTSTRRFFLVLVLAGVVLYAFVQQQERLSNWVGVTAATGVLLWLRFPRLRAIVIALALLLLVSGRLLPGLYQFAGGDEKWQESGGSREVLIQRVIEVSLRNPITGLGPASYRPYANSKPLLYGYTYWLEPKVSSHNNYVDLFAHTGLVGLGLFLWFMFALARLGYRLHQRYQHGFLGGYVNAMLAAWLGIMAIMLLADWFLPFVYNIGFDGFQASVLVWMFFGGLVAIENLPVAAPEKSAAPA